MGMFWLVRPASISVIYCKSAICHQCGPAHTYESPYRVGLAVPVGESVGHTRDIVLSLANTLENALNRFQEETFGLRVVELEERAVE